MIVLKSTEDFNLWVIPRYKECLFWLNRRKYLLFLGRGAIINNVIIA